VARLDQRHHANAPGAWFVDTRCIDCGTCREVVPELFGLTDDQSIVSVQPVAAADEERAWLAADACPTASIGRSPRGARPGPLYPHRLDGPVFDLGHTSEDSFGASSYLVERPDGNLLVDSPVFTRPLADAVAARGGLAHVLLTHRDDVADAQRWAERFGARVWIHADDRTAAPFATDLVHGIEPAEVAAGVVAHPVPGHTRGSVIFVVDGRWAFTGDSLAWSHEREDLVAFRGACWYSWTEQTRSLNRFASAARFSWVLPGHGARQCFDGGEGTVRLRSLVARMGRAA
jgi:glyoxylase-like metal-dependent hydrolase (beta-lactamase superfamily II)/ferredoxin